MKWFVFFVLAIFVASGMRAMKEAVKLQAKMPRGPWRATQNKPEMNVPPKNAEKAMPEVRAISMEKCPTCAAYVVAGEGNCGRTGCPFPAKG